MIRVLRVLEYEFETERDYQIQMNNNGSMVPLTGSYSPCKGITIKSAIFMPTIEEDKEES